MREVQLTKGKVALVDDGDYEKVLLAGKWCMNGPYAFNAKHGTMHRFLLGLPRLTGFGAQVDHINNEPLDNRRANLRVVTPAQNQQNRHKAFAGHSKFKGAHWDRSRQHWVSRIRVDGKLKYLGVYQTDLEAANRYNEAAQKYFGDYARLNELKGAESSPLRGRPIQRRIRVQV